MKKSIWLVLITTALVVILAAIVEFSPTLVKSSEPDSARRELLKSLREEQESLKVIASRYPDPPVRFARAVLKDLTASHPTILLDVAIDVLKLMAKKYPMLPYDMTVWRAEGSPKARALQLINKSYPEFHEDLFSVLESKNYPERFFSMRFDIGEMVKDKYPKIGPCTRTAVEKFIQIKYRNLPLEIMRLEEDQNRNPRFEVLKLVCSSYPSLPHEVLEELRKDEGVELQSALIDALDIVENKYPGIMTQFKEDLVGMTAIKHPSMMKDLAELDVASADQTAMKIDSKYPGLYDDLARLFEAKYPTLREEIARSMKAHFPDVPSGVENMIPQAEENAKDPLFKRKWMVKLLLLQGEWERARRTLL